MKYDQWPTRWVKSENNNARWVSGLCREIKRDLLLHRDFCLKNYWGERWKRERKCEKGSHPQPLCSSRFYPLSWLWAVLCKKDLGPTRSNSKCQMEMMCVLLLRLFFIRKSFMGINQKKKRDKTLILWSWRVVIQQEKSLLFIIFIFSNFFAYHTVPAHVKARDCQVL